MAVARKVKVTRHGQTTIPKEIRRKLGIAEGSWVLVEASGRTVVLRPVPRLEDLAGSLSKYATVKDVKKDLDRAREEDD
ncbi:MAG TPA: AbrB/MazE/SpoVT family DNA-binding domain-containing protein [Thermoplasmata archaeon]|nr:AbrB/MazE/SpoVT family DNA-binding domain-containing protein [Thermoplasmata archaeon]